MQPNFPGSKMQPMEPKERFQHFLSYGLMKLKDRSYCLDHETSNHTGIETVLALWFQTPCNTVRWNEVFRWPWRGCDTIARKLPKIIHILPLGHNNLLTWVQRFSFLGESEVEGTSCVHEKHPVFLSASMPTVSGAGLPILLHQPPRWAAAKRKTVLGNGAWKGRKSAATFSIWHLTLFSCLIVFRVSQNKQTKPPYCRHHSVFISQALLPHPVHSPNFAISINFAPLPPLP